MLLHTPLYLLFLTGVGLVYWPTRSWSWRKRLLLVASYIFYVAFDWRFAALLLALTLAVFLLGQAIQTRPHAQWYAWFSILLNLGLLCVFKYANFFIDSAARTWQLFGLTAPRVGLDLLLPLGISFYTFQAMAYTTEIYRKKLAPAGFVDFALYLAFFPKLIAGPLARPAAFFKQLAEPAARPSREVVLAALGLLGLGLFKKVVIADSLATLADVSFRAAALPSALSFPAPLYWRGFYLYAFQLYADFSGYTDIARASALLLGFSLPENFRQPYLAATPGEFWNRWHITLTHWFREYLFFPLSRWLFTLTRRRFEHAVQTSATLLTMLLIGLWHGAAWTFVVWGLWHGLLLSVDRWLGWQPARAWQKILMGLLTFHLIGLGWVMFGADSFATAARFLQGLFSLNQLATLPLFLPPAVLAGGLLFGLDFAASRQWPTSPRWRRWLPIFVIAALTVITSLWLLRFASGADPRPFIYGQF